MKRLEKIRLQILEAKDLRWQRLTEASEKLKSTTVTFKLNIPSWPKTSDKILRAFTILFNNFLASLEENLHSYFVIFQDETPLGPEAVLAIFGSAEEIKKLGTDFEDSLPVGRLLDIDVYNKNLQPIERPNKRTCIICDAVAINCMRSGKHSPLEVRKVFEKMLSSFLDEKKQE